MTSRHCVAVMASAVLCVTLAGCSKEADTMSRYPYFIETLNERWVIIRASFASDKPNISLPAVLLTDLVGTVEAMEGTYSGPNRDAAIAKLKEVYTQLYAELDAQLVLGHGNVTLKFGATAKGVSESIEKAYKGYTEFQELVKVK
ncbi:MAG TPA: hypothetical protein VFJ30_04985 [Phycisphaerae bacterium]|nr:hypothetical protein [Phycisphaerae bacterium]